MKNHTTDHLNVTSRAQVYRKVIALKGVSPVPAEKPTHLNKQMNRHKEQKHNTKRADISLIVDHALNL